MHKNPPFSCQKSKKISGETPPQWGGGNPLPTPHPLGAYGASILAPSALDLVAFGASSPPLPSGANTTLPVIHKGDTNELLGYMLRLQLIVVSY